MTAVYVDDRTTFYLERDQRYALGDPASPLLVLNAVDAQSCVWVADAPDGWDAPEVTLPMDRRQEGHGGYSGVPSFEARALNIAGTVTAPSPEALDAAYRRFIGAVLGSMPGFIRYTHLDEAPAPMGLWVQPSGRPRWRALDTRVAEFACVLVAEDPIKTGEATTSEPVRLPAAGGDGGYRMGNADGTGSGLRMPAVAIASTTGITVAVVANDGDEDSHAIYTVQGPVPRPRIQLGTGAYAALNADLGASDVWVVDTAAGTSTVNGVNRYDAWALGSTFPLIPGERINPDGSITPGGTEVRLRSSTGGISQAASLTVTTAPSWK